MLKHYRISTLDSKLEPTVHTKIIFDGALDALRVCFQISSGSAHKTGLQDGGGL